MKTKLDDKVVYKLQIMDQIILKSIEIQWVKLHFKLDTIGKKLQ